MDLEESNFDISQFTGKYVSLVPPEYVTLIVEFFIMFSRFEYMMKKVGYRRVRSNDSVKPDWDGFCNDFKGRFKADKSESLARAVNYYLIRPTKIQVFRANRLQWRKNVRGDGEDDFTWLMRTIRYTRNNLFHGGKFPFEPLRDTKLLYYGLVILSACIEMDKKLLLAFNP